MVENKNCNICDRKNTCIIDDDYRNACKRENLEYYRKIILNES